MTYSDAPYPTSKRKKKILKVMWDLGGLDNPVTTRQIAQKTKLNVNGVSQTLGSMWFDVDCLGGRGGERKWKLKNCYAGTL